ncbi:MAG: thioredoxin family protein, partial [Planktotalea sp.]
MFRHLYKITLAVALSLGTATAAFAVDLIMVEQKGCHYCEAWMDEIAPAYPKTDEGKFAPLLRRDIHDGAPDGM